MVSVTRIPRYKLMLNHVKDLQSFVTGTALRMGDGSPCSTALGFGRTRRMLCALTAARWENCHWRCRSIDFQKHINLEI